MKKSFIIIVKFKISSMAIEYWNVGGHEFETGRMQANEQCSITMYLEVPGYSRYLSWGIPQFVFSKI